MYIGESFESDDEIIPIVDDLINEVYYFGKVISKLLFLKNNSYVVSEKNLSDLLMDTLIDENVIQLLILAIQNSHDNISALYSFVNFLNEHGYTVNKIRIEKNILIRHLNDI